LAGRPGTAGDGAVPANDQADRARDRAVARPAPTDHGSGGARCEAAQASWEASVPANWRDLSFDEIEEVLDLMEKSGWALVWTPRAEIIRMLLETGAEARGEALLAAEGDVLVDLLAATDGLARPELVSLAEANRESIGSYRDGRFLAAQALSTITFTTLFHRHIDAKFADARTKLEPLDPRDATISNIRLYCVLRAVLLAIEAYYGRDDEAIPTRFNRHASTHRLSAEQYTRLNALAAIMLMCATSYLLKNVIPLSTGPRVRRPRH
jgi:hypothetical protein